MILHETAANRPLQVPPTGLALHVYNLGMGVDHEGRGTSPPEFGAGELSPPRFCHVAKF